MLIIILKLILTELSFFDAEMYNSVLKLELNLINSLIDCLFCLC